MDDDAYELMKRRLQDDVREHVEKKLFRTYALVGAAIIVTAVYASFDFVEETKEKASNAADEAVREAMAEQKEVLDEVQTKIDRQTGRIDSERDRASNMLTNVSNQLSLLDVEASTLAKLNETVKVLSASRRGLQEDIAKIKGRSEQLSVLSVELTRLAQVVQVGKSESQASELKTIVNNIKSSEEKSKKTTSRTTVYLQFAGGVRGRAEELSERLTERGFFMPGEERHSGAAGKREIRYYYDEDLEAAEKLAKVTMSALSEMGYGSIPEFKISDFTEYSRKKPKQGIVEMWVEL